MTLSGYIVTDSPATSPAIKKCRRIWRYSFVRKPLHVLFRVIKKVFINIAIEAGIVCMLEEVSYEQHINVGFHKLFKETEVSPGNILHLINNELIKICFNSIPNIRYDASFIQE